MKELLVKFFEDMKLSRTITIARIKMATGAVTLLISFIPMFEAGFWVGIVGVVTALVGALDEYVKRTSKEGVK
jgi:hypothetical protein